MAASEVAAGAPALPRMFRVESVRRELSDTFTLKLTAKDKADAFRFRAGQFNMLYAFGAGEAPISMSGDPADPEVLVHTIRSVGNVTNALCRLKRGDPLGVRGPYGAAWPLDESRGHDVVIVAGGIGIAPLRGVIYAIGSQRKAYGRVSILVGARTPQDFLYHGESDRWRRKYGVDVDCTVDAAGKDWTGHVGFVTALISRVKMDPGRTVAMICGPEIMMKKTTVELMRRGAAPNDIYVSMERNMKCAIGFCGHCQFGPEFICKNGPVFQYSRIERFLNIREL